RVATALAPPRAPTAGFLRRGIRLSAQGWGWGGGHDRRRGRGTRSRSWATTTAAPPAVVVAWSRSTVRSVYREEKWVRRSVRAPPAAASAPACPAVRWR